jgi:hypothetical protein
MLDVGTADVLSIQDENQLAIVTLEDYLQRNDSTVGLLLSLLDFSENMEDPERAGEYAQQLGALISPEKNQEYVTVAVRSLQKYQDALPGSLPEIERIAALAKTQNESQKQSSQQLDERRIYKFDLASELVLVHRLQKARMLTTEDYNVVINDLCSYSSVMLDAPSTVSHILHDRGLVSYEKAMEFISEDSNLPMVSLKCFEMRKEAFSLLHMEFMKYRAALVFDIMEGEALVAILNPYNKRLQQDVGMLTNTRCHFYLVKAEDYDAAVDAVRQVYLRESGVY